MEGLEFPGQQWEIYMVITDSMLKHTKATQNADQIKLENTKDKNTQFHRQYVNRGMLPTEWTY